MQEGADQQAPGPVEVVQVTEEADGQDVLHVVRQKRLLDCSPGPRGGVANPP